MTAETTGTDSDWSNRARNHLDNWLPAIAVVFLLIAISGGWLAYQVHASPGTEIEEQTVSTWDEEASVTHQVDVTRPNPVYELNETLSNHRVYFTEVSPVLAGEYGYSYTASDEGELTVEQTATLLMQAVDDEGEPYWQLSEPLDRQRYESLSPGEDATIGFEFNVSEATEQIDRTRTQLGTSIGQTELVVVFDTQLSGEVNGQSVVTTHRDELQVDPGGGSYDVEASELLSEQHHRTEQREVPNPPGPAETAGGPLLLLFGGAGIVGVGLLRRSGRLELTETERDNLEYVTARREFDEWITTGTLSPRTTDRELVVVDDLEGIVDIAIDTNRRVLEDRESKLLYVKDPETLYLFVPPLVHREWSDEIEANGQNGDRESTSGSPGYHVFSTLVGDGGSEVAAREKDRSE